VKAYLYEAERPLVCHLGFAKRTAHHNLIAGDAAKLDNVMRVLEISREQLAKDVVASQSETARSEERS